MTRLRKTGAGLCLSLVAETTVVLLSTIEKSWTSPIIAGQSNDLETLDVKISNFEKRETINEPRAVVKNGKERVSLLFPLIEINSYFSPD